MSLINLAVRTERQKILNRIFRLACCSSNEFENFSASSCFEFADLKIIKKDLEGKIFFFVFLDFESYFLKLCWQVRPKRFDLLTVAQKQQVRLIFLSASD